ncbi:MAG TPA: Uma2 family endonuclease [Humisphaera sp.]
MTAAAASTSLTPVAPATAGPVVPPRVAPPARFQNGAEWMQALGNVPIERVVFDPWPGTATEADLLRLVERDKRLCELIDGTLVEKPVGYWESRIAVRLAAFLLAFVESRDLGAVLGPDATLRMSASDRIRLPDVSFISKAREPTGPQPVPTIAPDLAVEVLSESNTRAEMAQKLREYFGSGTRLAWYVDPVARTVAVYHRAGEPTATLGESDVLDGDVVLPGFTLPVAKLFANIPPLG